IDDKPQKTKSGQYSTNEEVLAKYINEHPIIQKIFDARSLHKLKSTYVDTLPKLISKRTGRIHTSYNQAVTSTGRLSSNDPNLQNIPIRTEQGRKIRAAFVPRDKDHILLAADYSQIELRIMAELSQDEGMVSAFKEGRDIHAATASKVYGTPHDKVDKEQRRKAKTVNFGIIYGISAYGLSQRINISRKEAAEIIDTYFEQYPDVKKYMDTSIEFARNHGYVQTIKGRKRYLNDINSNNATVRGFAERNAINAPIQGSAADMIKIAMIDIYNAMKKQNFRSKMILQVHDELVFDAHKNEIQELENMAVKKMKNAFNMNIPIKVDTGTGQNWLEAH
ncbi:MAG: DNA polymerase, partial [Flavobacteriales bacterium]